MHFEVQILQGASTGNLLLEHFLFWQCLTVQISTFLGIECMAQQCDVLVPEDFALSLLTKSSFREKYQQYAFHDYVKVSIPHHLSLRINKPVDGFFHFHPPEPSRAEVLPGKKLQVARSKQGVQE